MRNMRMMFGELWHLDPLGEACAEAKSYEFLLSAGRRWLCLREDMRRACGLDDGYVSNLTAKQTRLGLFR